MGLTLEIVLVCCVAVALSSAAVPGRCQSGVECILLERCGINKVLQSNRNEYLVSLVRSLHCGFNDDKPMICCPLEYGTHTTQQNAPHTTHQGAQQITQHTVQHTTKQTTKPSSLPTKQTTRRSQNLLPDIKVCGIQNTEKIFGGTATKIDEHPWMALLKYDKPVGSGYYCGGVLISKRYVVTAAHCIAGSDIPPSWKVSQVRLGEWDVRTKQDCEQGDCSPDVLDIPIEEIIVHERFAANNTNQHHDIALLRLAKDVEFNDFVKPICLPTRDLESNTFEDFRIEVAGWGKTQTKSSSDVKLKVVLPIVNQRECEETYKTAKRVIIDKQICAGGLEGQDSCRGDSGGPLMGLGPQGVNWVLVGVVSYGPSPCGTLNWPGVYTRVTSYMKWIQSNIRP